MKATDEIYIGSFLKDYVRITKALVIPGYENIVRIPRFLY